MPIITFVPASTESLLSFQVVGAPRLETPSLKWEIALDKDWVTLKTGGDLRFLNGSLYIASGEPEKRKSSGGTFEPANGWLVYPAGKPESFYVSLKTTPELFSGLCGLAERGLLPLAQLEFRHGCGMDYGHSPNGEQKEWDNATAPCVPVHEFYLNYSFHPKKQSENEADDDDDE